jgi:hypothetical protein
MKINKTLINKINKNEFVKKCNYKVIKINPKATTIRLYSLSEANTITSTIIKELEEVFKLKFLIFVEKFFGFFMINNPDFDDGCKFTKLLHKLNIL